MTSQQSTNVVRRFFAECSNFPNLEGWRDVCTPGYAHHDPQLPGVDILGIDPYIQTMTGFFTASPDISITIEDVFTPGDKMACRWTFRGTHRGDLGPIPATNKPVEVKALSIHRMQGDKIAECRVNHDAMGMMQQLGVAPTP